MDLRDAKQPVIVIHVKRLPTVAALRHDLISVSNMAEPIRLRWNKGEKRRREKEKRRRRFFENADFFNSIYFTRSFFFV